MYVVKTDRASVWVTHVAGVVVPEGGGPGVRRNLGQEVPQPVVGVGPGIGSLRVLDRCETVFRVARVDRVAVGRSFTSRAP